MLARLTLVALFALSSAAAPKAGPKPSGLAGPAPSPPVDPSKCHEQCIISPTACSERAQCAGCGALCFGTDPNNPAYDRLLEATGTSLQTSAKAAFTGQPWEAEVRSADFVLKWSSIEPTAGTYDWSDMSAAIVRAQAAGKKLSMLLWTGPDSPDWLYSDFLVERLAWNDQHGKGWHQVPNYMNAHFQERLKVVHLALKAELAKHNEPGRAVVVLQPCVGSTGDDTPVHADKFDHVNQTLLQMIGGPGSGSNSTWWEKFFSGTAVWLSSAVFPQAIAEGNFTLLVNAQGASFPLDWVAKHLPGSFLKFGQTGHEYQSNYERFRSVSYAPYMYSLHSGQSVRSRAELSSETCWTSTGEYSTREHQAWNFYAMTQWVASTHLDFWNLQPNAAEGFVDNMTYAPLWRFLNRYAGLRWARQSHGAWIGFRDGLDAMDTSRFNESFYGTLDTHPPKDGTPYPTATGRSENKDRALAVCAAFAAQGCKIEVPGSLLGGPMVQRRMPGMNDVAFGNWQGDYGGFLRQTKPEASMGFWRVGSDSQMFGRFARGFAFPNDPSATIGLAFDSGLWGGLPMTTKQELTLRIIFMDSGKGSFSIHYDALSGPSTLTKVQKKNSGLWRELCEVLPDARFNGAGPQEADIWLTNDDDENDLFDSLEVAKGQAAELGLQGCDWNAEPLTFQV